MLILGIETSCDETALSLLECDGNSENPTYTVRAEIVRSQIDIHRVYGGVFPAMAKRAHAQNLIPLFEELLRRATFYLEKPHAEEDLSPIETLLSREPGLFNAFKKTLPGIQKPPIDAIAVTAGPGLEPALWVGINFANALGAYWNIPVYPTNHMEGHLLSVLVHKTQKEPISFPALALLISGGHTELVLAKQWLSYTVLGETRDDAVGEAYDKVARILGLPYPGGPEIAALATEAENNNYPAATPLPRPMRDTADFDFSFSGLKTAVLYRVRKMQTLSPEERASLAREFQDAVIDVLTTKTARALTMHNVHTLIIGGGVIANVKIRNAFEKLAHTHRPLSLLIPDLSLSTDNATMIAAAAYLHIRTGAKHAHPEHIVADGTLSLEHR